jgi:hypothetical protein
VERVVTLPSDAQKVLNARVDDAVRSLYEAVKRDDDLGVHLSCVDLVRVLRDELEPAGPKRNDALMALMPTVGYAYPLPQSRGTWDMVRKLKLANVPVFVADEVLA